MGQLRSPTEADWRQGGGTGIEGKGHSKGRGQDEAGSGSTLLVV